MVGHEVAVGVDDEPAVDARAARASAANAGPSRHVPGRCWAAAAPSPASRRADATASGDVVASPSRRSVLSRCRSAATASSTRPATSATATARRMCHHLPLGQSPAVFEPVRVRAEERRRVRLEDRDEADDLVHLVEVVLEVVVADHRAEVRAALADEPVVRLGVEDSDVSAERAVRDVERVRRGRPCRSTSSSLMPFTAGRALAARRRRDALRVVRVEASRGRPMRERVERARPRPAGSCARSAARSPCRAQFAK